MGENILHEAATFALKAEDARFFIFLVQVGFPLYEEDKAGNMAPFIIANVKQDSVFLDAYSALNKAGFNPS